MTIWYLDQKIADNADINQVRIILGSRRGQAALEVGMLLPWLVITFMAVLDFGFCAYGLIATENAARSAAAWAASSATNATSSGLASTLCTNYVLPTLLNAPNVGSGVSTCSGTSPVRVTTTYTAGGGTYTFATLAVQVQYNVPLMAIPGISPSSLPIVRSVTLPVR